MRENLRLNGAIAQLEERLICIQEVVGSIPSGSTIRRVPLALAHGEPNRSVNGTV